MMITYDNLYGYVILYGKIFLIYRSFDDLRKDFPTSPINVSAIFGYVITLKHDPTIEFELNLLSTRVSSEYIMGLKLGN